jgi:curved DNA-binding protein CbpA
MSRSIYGHRAIGEWFKGLTTPDEIKRHYRKLAFEFHPDRGGETEVMQEINNAYHEVLSALDNKEFNDRTYRYNYDTEEALIEKINLVIRLEGVEVEICGVWVWVTGDTYPHREYLKECEFKYARKKKAWYFHNMRYYKKHSKEDWSMNDIRRTWGSRKVEEDDEKQKQIKEKK